MLPLMKVMKPGASSHSRFGGRPGEGRVALFVQAAARKGNRPYCPGVLHLSLSFWSRLETNDLQRQAGVRARGENSGLRLEHGQLMDSVKP
jgi:hypothetical protein